MIELYYAFKFWFGVIAIGLLCIGAIAWLFWIDYCNKQEKGNNEDEH